MSVDFIVSFDLLTVNGRSNGNTSKFKEQKSINLNLQ